MQLCFLNAVVIPLRRGNQQPGCGKASSRGALHAAPVRHRITGCSKEGSGGGGGGGDDGDSADAEADRSAWAAWKRAQEKVEEQRSVWSSAREVTVDMEDMKASLQSDLEAYDPDAALDNYREVARDLRGGEVVTPPGANLGAARDPPPQYPRAPPGGFSTYGGDVMLDTDEELTPRDPKAETDFWRAAAREVAPVADADADAAPTPTTTSDAFADAVAAAKIDPFAQFDAPPPSAQTTPQSATYGGDAELDTDTDEVPLRDPKAETDFWRSAAREVVEDLPTSPDASTGLETASDTSSSDADAFPFPRGAPDAATYGGDAELDIDIDGVPLRDPKAETDFWRSAAREVVQDLSKTPGVSTTSAGEAFEQQAAPIDASTPSIGGGDGVVSAKADVASQREPTAETDFWRGAARELELELESGDVEETTGVILDDNNDSDSEEDDDEDGDEDGAAAAARRRARAGFPPTGVVDERPSPPELGADVDDALPTGSARSLFDAFRTADARWASALDAEESTPAPASALDDGARWRAWDASKGASGGGGGGAASKGTLGDDTSMWMRAAREVSGGGDESDDDEVKVGEPAGSTSLWAGMARDITATMSEGGGDDSTQEADDGTEA